MSYNIDNKFELYKRWVETSGNEGEKLCLEEVDFRKFDLSDKLFEQENLVECVFDNLNLEKVDISIATFEKPILLKSQEAKKWMLENCL
ncbi:hypothetical protein NL50_17930 [Clostridium acetobutylicum]|nr:hypothetical protein NL50_17930 [Clostridium acetobutylicum]